MKDFIHELKTYLKENVSKFTSQVQGSGGCDTCGYGAAEYNDLDMDDLEKQIDLFAATFAKKKEPTTSVRHARYPGEY